MISNSGGSTNAFEPSTVSLVVQPILGQAGSIPWSNLTLTCSFMHEKQKRWPQPSTAWILETPVSSKQMLQVSLLSLLPFLSAADSSVFSLFLSLTARDLAISTLRAYLASFTTQLAWLCWTSEISNCSNFFCTDRAWSIISASFSPVGEQIRSICNNNHVSKWSWEWKTTFF